MLWNVLRLVLLGTLAGSVIVSSYFIYQNIYQTLNEVNSIVILNATTDIDIVDIDAYEKAAAIIALKNQAVAVPADVRSIFAFDASSTEPFAPPPSAAAPASFPHSVVRLPHAPNTAPKK